MVGNPSSMARCTKLTNSEELVVTNEVILLSGICREILSSAPEWVRLTLRCFESFEHPAPAWYIGYPSYPRGLVQLTKAASYSANIS